MITITAGIHHKYLIMIGSEILHETNKLTKNCRKICLLTDTIAAKHAAKIKATTKIIIPAGEEQKNIETVKKIWQELINAKFDRTSIIINIGGGVITDLGGFVAATYMRGIPFINIPTTLLAMTDASIGGKTGINFAGIKNIIGTINPPKAIIADINTIKTLPDRQFLSGFAEMIKHGIIKSKKYFRQATKKQPRQYTQKELETLISRSCKIKAAIVTKDESETGQRKLLNYGHTVGHAIEVLAKGRLGHGEAVAIGMVAEAKISQLLGILSQQDFCEIENAISKAGLPTRYCGLNISDVWEKMEMDKKNVSGRIMWSLPRKIGKAVYNIEAQRKKIMQALQYIG